MASAKKCDICGSLYPEHISKTITYTNSRGGATQVENVEVRMYVQNGRGNGVDACECCLEIAYTMLKGAFS